MHSTHGRKRYRIDEEEELALTRLDQHRENYTSHSRRDSHNPRSNSYRGGKSSQRASYPDTTSRSHRDNDDWRGEASHSGHERLPTESYHHNRHDDYLERPERSNSDLWQTRPSNRYSNTKRESRRTAVTQTQTYAEERMWVVSARYEETRTEPRREDSPPRYDHERARYEPDDYHTERDKYSSHRSEYRVEQSPERASSMHDYGEKSQLAEDRTWVPAASWKPGSQQRPSQRTEFQSSRNNDKRSARSNTSRKSYQLTPKRNWRTDDSKTNNWQKREMIPKNSSASYNRDQFRSRSPSPSPSISRQSSVRSRSPSVESPQRPPRQNWKGKERKQNNHSYSENKRKNQKQRKPSLPPSTSRKNGDGWSRSRKSSVSISSRSRSRSRSPSISADEKPKAKHRLPTATSINDIKKSKKDWRRPVEVQPYSGELLISNGRDWKPDPPPQNEPSQGPPEAPPLQSKRPVSPVVLQEPAVPVAPLASALPFTRAEVTYNKPTVVAIKKPGFKPINQSSAAMKKFFPGDDDESDQTSTRDDIVPTRSPARTPIRSPREERNGHESLKRRSNNEWPSRDRSPYDRSSTRSHRKSSPMERTEPHGRDDSTSHHREDSESYDNSHRPSPTRDDQEAPRVAEPQQELYAIVNQVGEGTFGKVYKARNTATGVNVALKRIRMEAEKDGFPVTAMREIKLLQSLRHQNVVQLYEMMVSSGAVYMVFEYMDHDLTGVLSQTQFSFTDAHLKSLCQQMLAGLAYLHHKGVIHRDIKGSNILINNRGQLKLGDFGLARFYQKRRRSDYTNRVITLWYRPPELLLGTTVYGPEVDMWSAGCIMLELYCKKPVFQGEDEIHQLEVIYKILGTPTPSDWPGLIDMPWFELVKVKENIRNRFREFFNRWMSPAALDLAEGLLTFDPERRVTAAQALVTPYFNDEQPPPSLPVGLATLEGEWHEFESKRERAKKRRKIEEQQSSA